MANSNGSFGLRPLNKMGGAANSTATSNYSLYEIANGNTHKLYHGQPVIPLASGYIDAAGAAAGGTVGLLGVFPLLGDVDVVHYRFTDTGSKGVHYG